ncbi:MBL fold metallo-hydrolase [Elusimicrobiota bacterium]
MKKLILAGLAAVLLSGCGPRNNIGCNSTTPCNMKTQKNMGEAKRMVSDIHWLGHDSFRIEWNGLNIYIDPYKLGDAPKADIILITHEHKDHCSPEDVALIRNEDTVIVTVKSAAEKLSGSIRTVAPGDKLEVKNMGIEVVPAYNINKFRSPGVPFHPKEAGHAGYIINLDGIRIYHAGDTDMIPEMGSIITDIALLPVSGKYVMTVEEALEAAKIIKTQIIIPMHLGRGIGSMDYAEDFKKNSTVYTVVLPIEE